VPCYRLRLIFNIITLQHVPAVILHLHNRVTKNAVRFIR